VLAFPTQTLAETSSGTYVIDAPILSWTPQGNGLGADAVISYCVTADTLALRIERSERVDVYLAERQ
jgi:hypothetical protein